MGNIATERDDSGAGRNLDVPLLRFSPQNRTRTLDSRDLFAGTNEIGIEHAGALYRLKITRQGKLILNK